MDKTTIISMVIPVLAAVIGGLATAFFSRPKKSSRPRVIIESHEATASLSKFDFNKSDGKKAASVIVKTFNVENQSDQTISDLVVELTAYRLGGKKWEAVEKTKGSLLQSHYDRHFDKEKNAILYRFSSFPKDASFESTITVDDFWVSGEFKAYSDHAEILTPVEFESVKAKELQVAKKRLAWLYVATFVTFLFVIIFLLLR